MSTDGQITTRRVIGTRSATKAATAAKITFHRFPKFPAEIQDMIWDEALAGVCILDLSSSWYCRSSNKLAPWRRTGFDPLPVALSCQAAVKRWRKLYPFFTLDTEEPKHGVRLNLDWTVIINTGAGSPDEYSALRLQSFFALLNRRESMGQLTASLFPRHLAYIDFWPHKRARERWGNLICPYDSLTAFHLRANTSVQTVIAISGIGNHPEDSQWTDMFQEITKMMENPAYRGQCRRNCECATCEAKSLQCWRLEDHTAGPSEDFDTVSERIKHMESSGYVETDDEEDDNDEDSDSDSDNSCSTWLSGGEYDPDDSDNDESEGDD